MHLSFANALRAILYSFGFCKRETTFASTPGSYLRDVRKKYPREYILSLCVFEQLYLNTSEGRDARALNLRKMAVLYPQVEGFFSAKNADIFALYSWQNWLAARRILRLIPIASFFLSAIIFFSG